MEIKPAIICLHGHGSSGEIFHTQSRQLIQVLSPYFRFLFVNSPLTTAQAGVGVQPHYAHIKPYRRWHQDENAIGLFDVTAEDVERERLLVRDSLNEVIERERQNGPGGSVVGVMGFSQGARVATALCLDPELGRDIKFAIMVCGICPTLALSAVESKMPLPLNIVSVHVQGSVDPWTAKGKKLSMQYFNQGLARVVKFKGGHEIPVKTADVQRIAEAMAEFRGHNEDVYDSRPAVETGHGTTATSDMITA